MIDPHAAEKIESPVEILGNVVLSKAANEARLVKMIEAVCNPS